MIGVVLAGGASSRFGGQPKGLIEIDGRAMALRVADVLAPLCTRVVIEARAGVGYEALGLPLVHARHEGKGPLAGIVAGLGLASADERAAFAPCDMPLLNGDVYRALMQAVEVAPGAYAETVDGFEPLVAVLEASMRRALSDVLAQDELPRTHALLDAAGALAVMFDDGYAFANVNTPEDIERMRER
ncbi:MAG: molybdenum cofactor guanylyltransferase [Alphaproteobacteria bacterium]|jgi:molybdopterin-guanine dinucleotide biosynthesis protein A|nr:molybdenum cofactor guanylyltransferase [Alphaproteobacteria bacterium]